MQRKSEYYYIKQIFLVLVGMISTGFVVAQSNPIALIGGSLTYTCSQEEGKNQMHEIILTIRRDCADTTGQRAFDPYAIVNVFTRYGHQLPLGLRPQLSLDLVSTRKVNDTSDECAKECKEQCVEEAIYKYTLWIPNCPGGYILAYQRCCRTEDLRNIQNPGLTGSTYWIHLTEQGIYECTSTPNPSEWPDRSICVNKEYTFDYSVTDPDGDSLAYKLYIPQKGASQKNPAPGRIKIPPYFNEEFTPPYSVENQLGGSAVLDINEKTGILTVTPDTKGRYIYGVLIEEWRGNNLLSEVRRDYEFNVCVPDCPDIVPPQLDSIQLCEIDTCAFITLASDYTYVWDPVEDLRIPGEDSITFKFCPGNESKTYQVTISSECRSIKDQVYIAVKDPSCRLENINLTSNITYRDSVCDFTITYDANFSKNCSIDNSFSQWKLIIKGDTVSSGTGEVFEGSYSADPCVDTVATVLLIVKNSSSCLPDTLHREIALQKDPVVTVNPQCICRGQISAALLENTFSCWSYSWRSDETLIFPNPEDSSVVMAAPDETTTYYVTVSNGIKSVEETVTIRVLDSLNVSIDSDGRLCNGMSTLIAQSDDPSGDISFEWSSSPLFDAADILSTKDTFVLISTENMVTIYLRGKASNCPGQPPSCTNVAEVSLVDSSFIVVPDPASIDTCLSEFDTVRVWNADRTELVSAIKWSTDHIGNLVNPNDLTANPLIIKSLPGQSQIALYYETTFNMECNIFDTILVPISGNLQLDIAAESNFCGDTVLVTAMSNYPNTIFAWSLDSIFSPRSIVSVDTSTLFVIDTVTKIYLRGISNLCTLTVRKILRPKPKVADVSIVPKRICSGDTTTVTLVPNPGDQLTVTWETNGDTISITDTSITVAAKEGLTTLEVAYWARSLVCPSIKCDSVIVIRIDTIIPPNPQAFGFTCTDSVKLTVDSIYGEGEIMWTVKGGDAVYLEACPTILLPGIGVHTIFFEPGPALKSCHFDRDSIIVEVPNRIVLTPDQDTSQVICAQYAEDTDSLLTLSVSTNMPEIPIVWTDQNGIIIDSGARVTINVFDPIVRLTATSGLDSLGCQDSVSYEFKPYRCTINIEGNNRPYCQDLDINDIVVSVTIDGAISENVLFEWAPESLIVSGANTSNPIFNAPESFVATVVITDTSTMCIKDTSFNVVITPNPEVTITSVSGSKILIGQSAVLNATSDADPDGSYEWSTGETTSSITVSPGLGINTYQVTVTDAFGCKGSTSIDLEVQECLVGIPTAFSPNNDNMNETFRVRSNCPLEDFEMKIINRWGEEIFSTTDQEPGWNGRFNNRELPPDAFAFCVRYRCPNETELKTEIGNVSLLR